MKCLYAAVCLPDYWPGHRSAHVSIAVRNSMSFKEIREALIAELEHGPVDGEDELADALRKGDNSALQAAIAAVREDVKPPRKGIRNPFAGMELSAESYAYFVFED